MTIGSLLLATAAAAHTHLQSTVPADKSRVPAAPAIELHFSEAARLTSLTLQHGKGEARPLAVPAKAASSVSVPVPALAPGSYTVSWRVAGADGHVVSGAFAFTIDPAANPAPANEGKPATPATGHQHQH